jgi:DNA-binding transcriptional MerR regulator
VTDVGTAQEIPDKLYYRIGEVAEITDVPAYVLRYWESEFKLLRPKKNEVGQRLYRRRDVDLILKIKSLLYEERLTLEGAKKRLAEDQKDRRQLEIGVRQAVVDATLRRLRQRLEGLRARLSADRPR